MIIMHGLISEANVFGPNPSTKDLARHLFTRMFAGRVVVVAENPTNLLESLRKQWLKLTRKVQAERADAVNARVIFELTATITRMQSLTFAAEWPDEFPADVYVTTLAQVLSWAPECRTLYVTCPITTEQLYVISALMPGGADVVRCLIAKPQTQE